MKSLRKIVVIALAFSLTGLYSCGSKNRSSATGWEYNSEEWGGFEKPDYAGQATGPGLVLIEGGTYLMGNSQQDVTFEYNNVPRRVTVPSFYMDETEVTNIMYQEYVNWLGRVYGVDFPEVVNKARPDTLVWRNELAYNEPLVHNYFRHPSYNDYPVVGVSWKQANDFAKWRTDRVNEYILVENKIIIKDPARDVNEDVFNTDAYLAGQYELDLKDGGGFKDYTPDGEGERGPRYTDGLFLPDYRLPTEAEWEFAAMGLIGNHVDTKSQELISDSRIFPWQGLNGRDQRQGNWQGNMLANYKRGRGDYGGLAGNANDNAQITADVYTYMPNDYGLYQMAGNVNEWVLDVYRPMSTQDFSDFNSFRGNVFKDLVKDEYNLPAEKDDLGRLKKEVAVDSMLVDRRNYNVGDARNFNDGDIDSKSSANQEKDMYRYGESTLISDSTRVYKGGSWRDELFWLSPGARRYLEEWQRTDDLGFRCAMIRLGGGVSNQKRNGMIFRESERAKKRNAKLRKFNRAY